MPEVLEVLEGGGGDEARRVPRWIRFCAYGAATAVALWYALDALDAGLARETAPSLPRPPGPVLVNAPVSALITLDGGSGPPSGTVVARLGPGESWRRVALGGTLMEVPAGVDPCAVPAGPEGDRAVLQQVWFEGLSRPGLRARDLTGAPRTVPEFEELLGYRDTSVWTMDALTPDSADASVRVRDGAAAPSRKVTAIELAWRSAVSRWPVALLDTAVDPGAPGTSVTGVLFSDAADPTLIQVDGHELHVEWPGMLGTGFHVERVLGFGRDTVVALDRGLVTYRVNAQGEALRRSVRLPEGWTVPDPPNTGQLAFTGDGFVQVVRSRDGGATALVHTDPRTGRSRIVPGSAGAGAVVASGDDVLFLVRGQTGATRTAYWDASEKGQARFLTETETAPSTRLVCALGAAG